MRMRRTAFIMALMTVFTVSLFAQNSHGRNYIKQNISEFEAASKEMTELSEELQTTSEKCQKLAPNFTKEQKQRFLKAAMKFASASKKIKIDV